MAVRAIVVCLGLALAACGGADDRSRVVGVGPIGWEVTNPLVPKRMDLPIVDGGVLLNSYQDEQRVVVTLVYGAGERSRLESAYDEWSAGRGGVKSGRGFEVDGGVAWQDSWAAGRSEVRLSECLNELSGEFDNLCVALTTWVGSDP